MRKMKTIPEKHTLNKADWRSNEIFKLINLYRRFECLWNYKNANYKRIDLKTHAWSKIARECSKDIRDVKKKIKHLRTAYLAEKKKVDLSKSSEKPSEFLHEPHLFYYNEMSFLDNIVIYRRNQNNLEETKIESSKEEVDRPCSTQDTMESDTLDSILTPLESPSPSITFIPLPSPTASSSKSAQFHGPNKRLPKINRTADIDIPNRKASTAENEALFASFGKTVALQLQQLSLPEATATMSEIHNHLTSKILAHLKDSNNLCSD